MPHESRLSRELRILLQSRRIAALGTTDTDGNPFVSMVPFAACPALNRIVIHVSGLAAHTRNLQDRPVVSLLVTEGETPNEPVHALQRLTIQGRASVLEQGDDEWRACRSAYLSRFPEAESMTQLNDFRFVAIEADHGRHVAGFGTARDVTPEEIARILKPA
ncbi:MAG TPA: pyridoxamine 5'-phosphate oxidase family protein, partial [Burkholderiaceae bacterium]|nr:pyridoxamine 5'-phosphate oxidase family protein [Burkholderiaceae bacterium]